MFWKLKKIQSDIDGTGSNCLQLRLSLYIEFTWANMFLDVTWCTRYMWWNNKNVLHLDNINTPTFPLVQRESFVSSSYSRFFLFLSPLVLVLVPLPLILNKFQRKIVIIILSTKLWSQLACLFYFVSLLSAAAASYILHFSLNLCDLCLL